MVLGIVVSVFVDQLKLIPKKRVDPKFYINYPCCGNKVDVIDENQLEMNEKAFGEEKDEIWPTDDLVDDKNNYNSNMYSSSLSLQKKKAINTTTLNDDEIEPSSSPTKPQAVLNDFELN